MEAKELIKNTGATFTPKGLADYLSERILAHTEQKKVVVLDPACGDGELLASMGEQLSDQNIDFTLAGYDVNREYLSLAKERTYRFGKGKTSLFEGDFLQSVDLRPPQLSLNLFEKESAGLYEFADIIIANPPYVRTQILGAEQAQALAQKFDLKGRVDLYYPFLIAMTASLKKGGVLGVITSNRYLFTKSGESVRKFLNERFDILEVADLGDTKIFDAAVLPALFIGRKKKDDASPSAPARFVKIYEELNGYKGALQSADTIFNVLKTPDSGYFSVADKRFKKTDGFLICNTSKGHAWELLSDVETGWVSQIDRAAAYVVGDLFKVRVGIKTTADKVFISDQWNDLGAEKPEETLLRELISQENIDKWGTTAKRPLQILYPHFDKNGKKETVDIEQYPKAKKYFERHEDRLKERKYLIDAGRKWYEIWVPHHPAFWSFPKLVFPDISVSPRFYFDEGGKLVNGNCYWIAAEKEEDVEKLLLIQGVANSRLMTKYHDVVFNNKLYSGRRRYFTQYVEKYPLPAVDSPASNAVVELVKKLNLEKDAEKIADLEALLETKVAEAFNILPVFNLD